MKRLKKNNKIGSASIHVEILVKMGLIMINDVDIKAGRTPYEIRTKKYISNKDERAKRKMTDLVKGITIVGFGIWCFINSK
jgi:hypothetical protein